MTKMNISIELSADFESNSDSAALERNYQKDFKPLLTFLNSHPQFPLAVSFTGPQLIHYAEKHPESIDLLHELIQRKQVEIVGGGFYAPIFPLLFPVDRSAQIDLMTTKIRSLLGKKPTGLSLFGSIWDNTLVTTLNSCGMEYVILDSTLIKKNQTKCFPLIASEQGKSIKILPSYRDLLPQGDEGNEVWLERIRKFVVKNKPSTSYFETEDDNPIPHVTISISMKELSVLLGNGTLQFISDIMVFENLCEMSFVLPQDYLKGCKNFIPAYISAGMDWNIAKWTKQPYVQTENNSHFPMTIHDFLNTYPQNRRLYERMMFISMLINQCKGGDKMRRYAASEKLWEAQSGYSYVNFPMGIPATAEKRQWAFKLLNEAEHYLRNAKEFKESLTSYDYDSDGLDEYVCQMEQYFAVVSLKGGQICDFEILKSGSNYGSSLSRIDKFDGCSDNYRRGLFVEHLGEESELQDYVNGSGIVSPLFSKVQFTGRKPDQKRREIYIEGRGKFSQAKLPVLLKKKYILTGNTVSVQYILKNESNSELKGFFAIEMNLAQTRFDLHNSQYKIELVHNEAKVDFDAEQKFHAENQVSFIQIKDEYCKRLFDLEPNEACGYSSNLISFKRPIDSAEPVENSHTHVSSLHWKISLAPGMETERTLTFSIIPIKK